MLNSNFLKLSILSVVALLGNTYSIAAEVIPKSAELNHRIEARWEALKNHDFEKAYTYQSPNFRSVFPVNLYTKQFQKSVEWSLTEIESVKYDADSSIATVIVIVDTKAVNHTKDLPDITTGVKLNEKWLFADDQWWYGVVK